MTSRLETGKFICLAAGGTGGHVFPALAVAERLQAEGHTTLLFTDGRGARMVTGVPQTIIAAASPFQQGLLRRLRALLLLSGGAVKSLLQLVMRRPAAMIGFGGYPSFPPLLTAALLRIPTMVHEQNAYLGRANKMLAGRAGHLALSWQQTANLPQDINCFTGGMPVRQAFFNIKPNSIAPDAPLQLTVLGGSLGAGIFADLLPEAIAALPAGIRSRLRLTQQCRPEQLDNLRAAYRELRVSATVEPFFDDIPDILTNSHLVISRAGASSVAELAAAGRAAILVPLPSAMDDHQTANAHQLANIGGGLCRAEAELDAASLAADISTLFGDGEQLAQMGHNARKLAMPDAAKAIADYALALGDNNSQQPTLSISGGQS